MTDMFLLQVARAASAKSGRPQSVGGKLIIQCSPKAKARMSLGAEAVMTYSADMANNNEGSTPPRIHNDEDS